MDLHTLKNAPGARKARKRVGRGPGSGTGKTAGRGHKGQKSRSGYSRNYGFEGGQMPLHRRLPKRGFNHGQRWPVAIVNVDMLCKVFEDGAEVTAGDIVEAGLADDCRGGVKVLGRGAMDRKLSLRVHAISPSARAKVEAAGGSVEILARTALKESVKESVKESGAAPPTPDEPATASNEAPPAIEAAAPEAPAPDETAALDAREPALPGGSEAAEQPKAEEEE